MKLSQLLRVACLGLLLGMPAWAAQDGSSPEACPHPKGWQPSKEELQRIISEHRQWSEAWEKMGRAAPEGRANLCSADLRGVELNRAELAFADLNGANLEGARLNEANLHYAELNGADLSNAELNKAKLAFAKLEDARLLEAELHEANLYFAVLYGTNLAEAKLNGANLGMAGLDSANLPRRS
jgi:uncharacterized protein YjbI with pentapeptide repeats